MKKVDYDNICIVVGTIVVIAIVSLVCVFLNTAFRKAEHKLVTESEKALTTLNEKRENHFDGIHDLKKSTIYLQNGDSVKCYITGIKTDILSFYWKDNDGYYNYCENLRDNIKYEIDESLTIPCVIFKWRSCELNYDDNYKNYIAITEIIIKGKEKDLTEVKL